MKPQSLLHIYCDDCGQVLASHFKTEKYTDVFICELCDTHYEVSTQFLLDRITKVTDLAKSIIQLREALRERKLVQEIKEDFQDGYRETEEDKYQMHKLYHKLYQNTSFNFYIPRKSDFSIPRKSDFYIPRKSDRTEWPEFWEKE